MLRSFDTKNGNKLAFDQRTRRAACAGISAVKSLYSTWPLLENQEGTGQNL